METQLVSKPKNRVGYCLDKLVGLSTDNTNLSDRNRRLVVIIALFITVLISFPEYTQEVSENFLFISWSSTISTSIEPNMLSMLAAMFFVCPIFLRNYRNIGMSAYSILLLILDLLFCASFMSIFCSDEQWNIPFITITSQSFLLIAIIMSWLCIRPVAGLLWIILLALMVFRVTEVDIAMGSWGVLYMICGAIGIIAQLPEIKFSFKEEFFAPGNKVKSDIHNSVDTATALAGTAVTAALKQVSKQ